MAFLCFACEMEKRGKWLGMGSGQIEAGLLQFLPEGKAMTNLATVVQQLRQERDQAQAQIERLDEALKALTGLKGVRGTTGGRGRAQTAAGTRRTMSVAARKRIAAAQRARWAKWKAAQRAIRLE